MRLAVDVMGGDHGPEELLQGVKLGLAGESGISAVVVVGPEAQLKSLVEKVDLSDPRVRIVHASEVLEMSDKPTDVLRKKKDSSLMRAVELIKAGEVDAVISSGNTGGLVAASAVRLRTLPGIERPTLACIMPSGTGAFVLVDGGANPECTPENLLQFAVMGSEYSRSMLGIARPRVGVLSNGSEESKGTDLTRATLALVRKTALHSIGYCEGHDLFNDAVDVVVCDGFTGNIVLKTSESLGKAVGRLLKSELTANPVRQVGALLAKSGLDIIKTRMNPEVYGGAPLLGLNGNVFKIHGSARRVALRCAMKQAAEVVGRHLNDSMVAAVKAAQSAIEADPAQTLSKTNVGA